MQDIRGHVNIDVPPDNDELAPTVGVTSMDNIKHTGVNPNIDRLSITYEINLRPG